MQRPYTISLICSLALTGALYSADSQRMEQADTAQLKPYQEATIPENLPPVLPTPEPELPPPIPSKPKEIEHFTGKVLKNRVRLRFQPSLDAPILKELHRGDLFVVTGVVDDFYLVLPPKKLKGYVFRTYVLDGAIEGTNVNVRLEPDTNAPILCQLNSGDKIQGSISPQSNKWLEIILPEKVRFYIAKEYITRVGDAAFFNTIEKKQTSIAAKLVKIEGLMQQELNKPFNEIKPAPLLDELNQLAKQADDLPKQKEKAESLIQKMQEEYLKKSVAKKQIALADTKDADKLIAIPTENEEAIQEESPLIVGQRTKETQPDTVFPSIQPALPEKLNSNSVLNSKSSKARIEQEQKLIRDAIDSGQAASEAEFYALDEQLGNTLTGVIAYNSKPVKNAPGDFILVDPDTNLPIAYLYSTKVDLRTYVGQEQTIIVAERPNNNFAYPAYFVLRVE